MKNVNVTKFINVPNHEPSPRAHPPPCGTRLIGPHWISALLLFLLCFTIPAALQAAPKKDPPAPLFFLKRTVEGVKIHFVETGRGAPLLFLHGLGGSWKDWGANLQFFSSSCQAMALDFPGFGDSDKPEGDFYSIEWFTEMVEKFLLARKIGGVHVVGHSMGALVALNLAARPGSRVKKLAVVDPVGIGDKAEFLSYVLTKKILGEESRFQFLESAFQEDFKEMFDSFIKNQKPKTAREFFQSFKAPFTGKPLVPMTPSVQISASVIDFDVHARLPGVRQPTLIFWGRKDPVAPVRDAALLKSKIPHASLQIMEGAGHSPMQEQPASFNQELGKFLQAAESGSSR